MIKPSESVIQNTNAERKKLHLTRLCNYVTQWNKEAEIIEEESFELLIHFHCKQAKSVQIKHGL